MTRHDPSPARMTRRTVMGAAALLASGARAQEAPAPDQGFPKSPIRVVVPYPPGGPTDVMARVLTVKMGEALGQPMVIDNRAGASGMLGAGVVAKAAPDGYTLLVNASIHVINPFVHANAPYDAFADFAPVSQLADVPLVLVVHPALPVQTVQQLVQHVRSHAGQVNFGSAGNASSQHLSGELFKIRTGVQMQHVPYKGSSPALTDLLGGQIQLMFDSMPSAMPFITSGKLRALAVTTAQRVPSLPDVPTMQEAGVADFQTSTWYGMWAPQHTPRARLETVWSACRRTLARPEVAAHYRSLGAEPVGSTPDDFSRYIEAEARKWQAIVRLSGARAD